MIRLIGFLAAVSFVTDAFGGTTYTPGAGTFGSVLFEDQWPNRGDGDLNDVVVRYNTAVTDDGVGNVSRIVVSLTVEALGSGGVCSGLALRLPVPLATLGPVRRSLGTAVAGTPWDDPASNLTVTSSGSESVVWITDDIRSDVCGGQVGWV